MPGGVDDERYLSLEVVLIVGPVAREAGLAHRRTYGGECQVREVVLEAKRLDELESSDQTPSVYSRQFMK